MKYFVFFIFLFQISCSFKKNPNNKPPATVVSENSAQKLMRSIQEDDTATFDSLFPEIPSPEIINSGLEGSILNLALRRGNAGIVAVLLDAKLYPYSHSSEFRNYQFSPHYDRFSFLSVISMNNGVAQELFSSDLLTVTKKYRIDCEALMDLTQDYRLRFAASNKYLDSSKFIQFFRNSETCDLRKSSYKNEWMDKELAILFLLDAPSSEENFFRFLAELFQPNEYNENIKEIIPTIFNDLDIVEYLSESIQNTNGLSSLVKETIESISSHSTSTFNFRKERKADPLKISEERKAQFQNLKDLSKNYILRTNKIFALPEKIPNRGTL